MPAFSTSSSSTIGVLQMTVASAISSARVCPPESSVMRLSRSIGSPVSLLAKSRACCTSSGDSLVAGANPRMGQQELADRQVGEERRVLGDQGDGVARRVVAELGRAGWPLIRIRRPVGVSASANSSRSLMSVVLPEPVGPTMLTTWPIVMSMRPKRLGLTFASVPAQNWKSSLIMVNILMLRGYFWIHLKGCFVEENAASNYRAAGGGIVFTAANGTFPPYRHKARSPAAVKSAGTSVLGGRVAVTGDGTRGPGTGMASCQKRRTCKYGVAPCWCVHRRGCSGP